MIATTMNAGGNSAALNSLTTLHDSNPIREGIAVLQHLDADKGAASAAER